MRLFQSILITLLLVTAVSPNHTYAKGTSFEVAGWIPYWRDSQGIKDAQKHLQSINTLFPFAYTVTTEGVLADQAGLTDNKWLKLQKNAQKKKVAVIPTVMWSDGVSIHTVLSGTTTRATHIAGIVDMVTQGKFDGVDIDYESKLSDTIDYYSLFLKELKAALGKKKLTCTVEARTPPESLYKDVPATIDYANDYVAIGKYCDRVEIMAYDQQRADLKLNAEKAGHPYMPVADSDWVRKVVELALKDIPKEKILLGIPTYGRHVAVTVAPNWYQGYKMIGALNMPDMLDIAKKNKVTPTLNRAGEMSFTYIPKSSDLKLSKSLSIPKDTPKGNIIAARALAYANKTGETVTINMAWYSDAGAIKQKIDLAKEYKLAGISLFKIDGEEDQKLWNYLK
jgi:spore germination protein YaaH